MNNDIIIKVKAKVAENENRSFLRNNKKVIEIKGSWTMKELQSLLGRLK